MGVTFNRNGFAVRLASGQMLHDSGVSALTRKRVGTASVLKAVPGTDTLYIRLHREDKPSGQQAKGLYQDARAWFEGLAESVVEIEENSNPDGDSGDPPSDDESESHTESDT